MESDRTDVSDCICHCGSSSCRGTYVKAKAKPKSPPPVVPITSVCKTAEYTHENHHKYKVLKMVQYLLCMTQTKKFVNWEYVSRQKHVAKRFLNGHGMKNLNSKYISRFISFNQPRIKSFLKTHGKILQFTDKGFGVHDA